MKEDHCFNYTECWVLTLVIKKLQAVRSYRVRDRGARDFEDVRLLGNISYL